MNAVWRIAENVSRYDPQPGVVVFLRDPGAPVTLLGPEWQTLLDAVGNGANAAEIVACTSDCIAPVRCTRMLEHLANQAVLLCGDQRASPYGTLAALSPMWQIRPIALGPVDQPAIERVLVACGASLSDDPRTLPIVFTDDYLDPALASFNRARLADRAPWLLAAPRLTEARIGPLFVPGDGPCWHCFEARNRARHQVRRFLGESALAAVSPGGSEATLAATVAALVPLVERFLTSGAHRPFSDHVRTIDHATGATRDHRLIRRPQCPECGEPAAAKPLPPPLPREDGRVVSHDGGHRLREPVITFEAMAHHLSPVTGMADALIDAHPDEQILCYGVVRSDVSSIGSARELVGATGQVGMGWGKGWTHAQARMSALGEAIERFSFSDERPPDHRTGNFAEMADLAVDPRSTLLFSDAQYEKAGTGEGHDRIPEERFDPTQAIGWTAARSLTNGAQRLIASDQMWLTPMPTRDGRFCIADSNGCAAGNTIEEATLQGLFELVERDAVAIWWYNQLGSPRVDLASFGSEFVALERHYACTYDRDIWVIDLTMDLGIRVFAAISALRSGGRPEYVACFGCHLDTTIAIQRALTEMGLIMVGWKDFLSDAAKRRSPAAAIGAWLRDTGHDDQPQMRPADGPMRRATDYAPLADEGLNAALAACVGMLERAGIETIVADATRPDIGLPVVRVTAPGLRHFRPRFAPGRLYDVPVALGYRAEPLGEAGLNPVFLPF